MSEVLNYANPDELEYRLPPGESIWIHYNPRNPEEFVYDAGNVYLAYTNVTPVVLTLVLASLGLGGFTYWQASRLGRR